MRSDTEQGARDERAVRRCSAGTNQAGMREQNERLVLSLVRRHGALAKSEIARMTGLSAQTVSVIMRHLEADRLLRRGEPQRGRVGQPWCRCRSTPRAPSSSAPRSGGAASTSCWSTSSAASATAPAPTYPFPTPRRHHRAAIRRRGRAPARRCSATAPTASPGSASRCPSSSGAGPRRSARPRPSWRPGADVDLRAELAAPPALPGLPAERRHRRLRRRARLRRPRRAASTSSTSTSAPSSAAGWC